MDVNEIFRDLGAMIHEQGEQIDTIEANVERAATHVEEGREQLTKAATYQVSHMFRMLHRLFSCHLSCEPHVQNVTQTVWLPLIR